MTWNLCASPSHPDVDRAREGESARSALAVESRTVRGRTRLLELEIAGAPAPGLDGEFLAVPIPLDFCRMLRETDVDDSDVRRIPLDWRLRTREVFVALFARGYRVIDFHKAGPSSGRNYYLLRRERS
jgi:hypothetical protein